MATAGSVARVAALIVTDFVEDECERPFVS